MDKLKPSHQQALECGAVTVLMRRYKMRHSNARKLLAEYGIDYGHSNTLERTAEAARKRNAIAMKLRRMKSRGVSDGEAALALGMTVSQILITRREYEIGHTDERKKRG